MDWEELAIQELLHRFEAVTKCIDKIVFPGLCGALPAHESTWPVLENNVAYLTGGVDKFGAPIIYLPSNENLVNICKADVQGVIQYLASATKASAADVGFVIVIDRRKDRWSSVNYALQSVSSSFPGDLRMIFILRPTSFLHSALSGIAVRWQREDINNKVPLELLSSVDQLEAWIDKNNLPEELGGSRMYEHSDWIYKRKLIERLATDLKTVIEECKTYSMELINVQFPQEEGYKGIIDEQNRLFKAFLERFDTMHTEGNEIVQNKLWESNEDVVENVNASKMDVEHLSSLILEVKDVFRDFWEKFVAKRTEYLSLRTFENDYKTASAQLSTLIESLEKNMNDQLSFDLMEENFTPQMLEEDKNLDLCVRTWSNGELLIDEHPHTIDCIKPKCDELKRLSGCFQNLISEKREKEDSILRIKRDIAEVNQWCTNGMTLLARQDLLDVEFEGGIHAALKEIDSFTSSRRAVEIYAKREFFKDSRNQTKFDAILKQINDAVSNVDDILSLFDRRKSNLSQSLESRFASCSEVAEIPRDKGLELEIKDTDTAASSASILNSQSVKEKTAVVHPILHCDISPVNDDTHKLKHVIKELVETERKYVEELEEIVTGYGNAIDDASMQELVPYELIGNKDLMLGNLEEILQFHQTCLLPEIVDCNEDTQALSELFVRRKKDFVMYYEYCQNSDRSKTFRKEIGENHQFFVECQKRLCHRLPLSAYLLKPVQRITKYQLLLQQIQKYSPHLASDSVEKAVQAMLDVVKELNDSMHQTSIRGFKQPFSTLGHLLLQGSFQVLVENKKSKVKELARSKFSKPLIRHLFLYENALLVCKQCQASEGSDGEKENGKNAQKARTGSLRNPEKEVSYMFKRCLKTSQITLTEVVKGYPTKFKLRSRGDEGELIVTATSSVIKQNWIKSLNNCLAMVKKSSSASSSPTRGTPQMRKKRLEKNVKMQAKSDDSKGKFQKSNRVPQSTQMTSRTLNEKISKQAMTKKLTTRKLKQKEEPSDEVNFGNIHGVDASPSKFPSPLNVHEELSSRIYEPKIQKPIRVKKKVPKTKASTVGQ